MASVLFQLMMETSLIVGIGIPPRKAIELARWVDVRRYIIFARRCDLQYIETPSPAMLRFGPAFSGLRFGSVAMWREYSDFAVTALAVVNGLIAITVALLPMRRSVLKLRLGAVALVVAALAVGATFYAQVRSYVQIERQQSDRAEIRMRLQNFIRRRPRTPGADQGRRPRVADDSRRSMGAAGGDFSPRQARRTHHRPLPQDASDSTATARISRRRAWDTGARCETVSSISRRSARNFGEPTRRRP